MLEGTIDRDDDESNGLQSAPVQNHFAQPDVTQQVRITQYLILILWQIFNCTPFQGRGAPGRYSGDAGIDHGSAVNSSPESAARGVENHDLAYTSPSAGQHGVQAAGGTPHYHQVIGNSRQKEPNAISGKIEHAVGAIVGSSAVKAQGVQKEQ